MVPNGWSNTCIDDNITFSGGAQPPREVFKFEPEEGYIRLIQIRDYKSDKFITYVPKKLAKKFCTADDVMIGRYGPPIFQILRGIEGAYNVALIKAIPKSGVDKEFMYYFLKRDPLLRVIESFSQRTSGQTGIEMDVLKAYPMHLPPLPEQLKIAQILSTWDRGIATTEKLIDTSKQQKKALMQQLLTGKKRLVDPETGKAFEGEWEKVKLSNIAKVSIGLVTTMTKHYVESGVPLIRNSDIKQNEIRKEKMIFLSESFASENEHRKLKVNDVVTVHTGEVGTSAVIEGDMAGCLGFATLNSRPNLNKVLPTYLSWYFNSDRFINWCISMSTGDGRQNLNLKDFVYAIVQLPELAEQQKIALVLTDADKEIKLLEAKLSYLKQEKKALMQQLLTGKRRVMVAETEAA